MPQYLVKRIAGEDMRCPQALHLSRFFEVPVSLGCLLSSTYTKIDRNELTSKQDLKQTDAARNRPISNIKRTAKRPNFDARASLNSRAITGMQMEVCS